MTAVADIFGSGIRVSEKRRIGKRFEKPKMCRRLRS